MKEPIVDLKLAHEHGLSEDEYERIKKILGRNPTFTELGVYSVMWSEHCSYKSSIKYLKTLPKDGKNVLAAAGEENAGALDIGNNKVVVFKIESHNHPSAVEPFQGAATGVGGILRDIFCMGARPIAALDSLRFGELSDPRQQHLFNGVVKGIARYGNCFGVPTVGGEVVFDDAYSGNCLVNAMAVGIAERDKMVSAKAGGIGNPVFILGASTGRDGIHGATFASEELTEKSQEDRPSVQIGDPFLEKLLLEATLEIIEQKIAYGIQDMGAAGITCSSSETAANGHVGIRLDLDKVPLREEGMIPYEILLSESQERMLIIAKKGREGDLERIAKKWELNLAQIGEVVEGDRFICTWRGKIVCDVPASTLVLGGGAPVYDRPKKKPEYLEKIMDWTPEQLGLEKIKPDELIIRILSMPSIAEKRWVFEQYDHQVGTDTVVKPGTDSAVMRVKETETFIAVSTDCNGRYCYLDPYLGAFQAVFESARNVVAVGARPIGITNCLNFGNPERPESFWQFTECVRGMGDACRALQIPVTGGNVSFYNESPSGAIYPTPVIGMIGIIEREKNIIPQGLKEKSIILLVGKTDLSELGGSALQKLLCEKPLGKPPAIDTKIELGALRLILDANEKGYIKFCHDLSDGGLTVALAESIIWGDIGAEIDVKFDNYIDGIKYLFSESQGRYIIGVGELDLDKIEELAFNYRVNVETIGKTNGKSLIIKSLGIDIPIDILAEKYTRAIPDIMRGEVR